MTHFKDFYSKMRAEKRAARLEKQKSKIPIPELVSQEYYRLTSLAGHLSYEIETKKNELAAIYIQLGKLNKQFEESTAIHGPLNQKQAEKVKAMPEDETKPNQVTSDDSVHQANP